ncbi:isochorismate synthase [Aquimarina intermedia]|uniref:isochorismate synthase n=1 Tax=Aquimarina intermedia TaxID=350814 RepID=A0A5S5C6U6_9FLAO|nr:isochorismate synthase [Aquimarina intermedia]TYP75017.1 isochorismate synthase [Aquimarina intermedia]
MKSPSLYSRAHKQINEVKPFVLFRRPDSEILESYYQTDNSLNYTEDLTDQGFVMAPFDTQQKSILFPLSKSIKESERIISRDTEGYDQIKSKSIDPTSDKHIALVAQGIQKIKEGLFDKVVLSREECLTVDKKDWIKVFDKLLHFYPTAFVYIWFHPKVGLWMGATPETLLSINKNKLSTMALAATQLYTKTKRVDWDPKEKKEQQLVTDYIREALEPLGDHLKISEPYTHRAGNLVHLRSDINAEIDFKLITLQEIVQKLHPTPAVCGLPKATALQFIKKHESYNRAFYTGYLGEIVKDDTSKIDADLYVNLRCMQIFDEEVKIYVGGGITKDSVPEKEWEETVRKTQTMKKVLW